MFNQYPYLNLNDLNLDYLLNEIKSMYNDVTNFVSINAIKYADPIQWNITSQYEKNTVVIDPLTGTAYISVAAVPSGVALTREEYWTVVFDLGSFITRAAKNFTTRYEQDTTTTATFNSVAGDWLVWGDTLYVANVNITAGDSYVPDGNIRRITVEEVKNTIMQLIADNYDTIVAMIADNYDTIVAMIADNYDTIVAMIGDLDDLTTTAKNNIVAAINELATANSALSDEIDDEVQSRQAADATLQDNIDDEVRARQDADTTLRELIESHVQFKTPQNFGAVGDGITDDTQAVQEFFNALLNGEVGFVPAGTYLCTSPIVIDYSTANIRQFKMFGAGCYRATFKSTITSGIAFLFTSGTGVFDSFHTVIDDIGFIADFAGVTLQIGKNDRSDAMGNYNFKNVFVGNSNTGAAATAAAARYNYLFDCLFENCVYVCGANGKGNALLLDLCRFCTFIGGSYSNAEIGIHFIANGSCDTLTFIGSDFENLDYAVYIESTNISGYIKFLTCYFDIWRPDLTPPTYGKNAVYSDGGSVGGFIFENCLFARGGIYGYGGLDLLHIKHCKFNGIYSYSTDPIPANGVAYTNNTGQDQFVNVYALNSDATSKIHSYTITNDIFPDLSTAVQLGSGGVSATDFILRTGATITLNYTGTMYWAMRPINIF